MKKRQEKKERRKVRTKKQKRAEKSVKSKVARAPKKDKRKPTSKRKTLKDNKKEKKKISLVKSTAKKRKITRVIKKQKEEIEKPALKAAPILEGASEQKEEIKKTKQKKEVSGYVSSPEKKKDIIIGEKEKKRLMEKYKTDTAFKKPPYQIEIKDIDSLSKKLKDETSVYILEYLRKKDYALVDKLFLGKTFGSEKELEKYLKEETVKLLLLEVDSLKARVSELRKKGGDINYSDFQIMPIPLKIKLFSASFDRKDFDRIIAMLEKASAEVKNAEKVFSASKPAEES